MALSLTRTTQGATSDANSNLNNNWTAIENLVNGNLDTTNLKTTTAAITAAQLAASVSARLNPSAPSTDNVAVWNGSAWVAQKLATAQISATAGILGSQLAAAAAIAPTQLAGGTTGQVLKSVGSTPTWSKGSSLQTNTTVVGTGASTSEVDLQSLTIAAADLVVGDVVTITGGGTMTRSSGAAVMRLYFGPTLICASQSESFTGTWMFSAKVIVTGASTQRSIASLWASNNAATLDVQPFSVSAANAISGTIVVKTTGQTTTAGDEVSGEELIVEVTRP